jgi:hypothetical protein
MHPLVIVTIAAFAMILSEGALMTDAQAGGSMSAPSKYASQTDHSPAAHNAMVRRSGIGEFSSSSAPIAKHWQKH